jgi:1-acyl-sn-glycerol-3-phosphate acyltransferase
VAPIALNGIEATRVSPEALRPAEQPSSRLESLERALRRSGTGFMFAVFGIGAVLLACVAFPITAWRRRGEARDLVAQSMVHRFFGAFERLGCALRLFEVRDSGAERLRAGPGLVVANHPTLLDVVFLVARMPQADCIVKAEALRNPFLRRAVSAAGYIANADGPAVVAACVERIRAGRSVIVFPEGTRSPLRGLRPFKRGAARVALGSQGLVTPVTLRCDPPALGKDQRWWAIPARRLVFTIEVGEPFHATDWIGSEGMVSTPRSARHLTAVLRDYFESKDVHAGD